MLRYRLYDNHFTPDNPEDCLARPVDISVKTREDLVKSIAGIVDNVSLQKVDRQDILPHIENIYDWGSRTNGDILTPDGVLEVTGDNLKIYNNLEVEGVFFVSEFNGYEANSPNDPHQRAEETHPAHPGSFYWRLLPAGSEDHSA